MPPLFRMGTVKVPNVVNIVSGKYHKIVLYILEARFDS